MRYFQLIKDLHPNGKNQVFKAKIREVGSYYKKAGKTVFGLIYKKSCLKIIGTDFEQDDLIWSNAIEDIAPMGDVIEFASPADMNVNPESKGAVFYYNLIEKFHGLGQKQVFRAFSLETSTVVFGVYMTPHLFITLGPNFDQERILSVDVITDVIELEESSDYAVLQAA